jgi:hypothetical protein
VPPVALITNADEIPTEKQAMKYKMSRRQVLQATGAVTTLGLIPAEDA